MYHARTLGEVKRALQYFARLEKRCLRSGIASLRDANHILIIFANVVKQCGPKTGVTVIEVRPGVGSVEFVVANFGSRACSGGDISKAETYLVNFFLLSPCVGFGLPDEAGNCP